MNPAHPYAIDEPKIHYVSCDLLNERACDYMLYNLRKKLLAATIQVPQAAEATVNGGIREHCIENERAYWQAAEQANEFEPGNKSFVLAAVACRGQAEMCR